jgi:hypothetical protein
MFDHFPRFAWTVLYGIAFGMCCEPGAHAQAPKRGGNPGRPDNIKIEGTLNDFNRGTILVQAADGQKTPVAFNTQTQINVSAMGPANLITMGSLVTVRGVATNQSVIEEAWITLHLVGKPDEKVFRYGVVAPGEPSNGRIPVSLVGKITSLNPVLFKADPQNKSEYMFKAEQKRDANGIMHGVVTHPFPGGGKTFRLELTLLNIPPGDREKGPQITLDLGNALQYAGKDARVTATIPQGRGQAVASSISVSRTEPWIAELEQDAKKAKQSNPKNKWQGKAADKAKED